MFVILGEKSIFIMKEGGGIIDFDFRRVIITVVFEKIPVETPF